MTKVEDIKKGDILVANYGTYCASFPRNYIVFMANGGYEPYNIPTILHIALDKEMDIGGSIGFKANEAPYTITKPTIEQYVELIQKAKAKGYKINLKRKCIQKIIQ